MYTFILLTRTPGRAAARGTDEAAQGAAGLSPPGRSPGGYLIYYKAPGVFQGLKDKFIPELVIFDTDNTGVPRPGNKTFILIII
jgi:hypothetical protein